LHNKNTLYPMIVLLLPILFTAACGTTSPQPTATSPQPTATHSAPVATPTPAGEILGTTTGKVLTSTDSRTGLTTITGVGVTLESGRGVDALLEAGVMDVVGAGIRVRVEPIDHPEFEWRVVEIVAGGAATPDLSEAHETPSPRCRLLGAIPVPGDHDYGDSLDVLTQMLTEKVGCEIELVFYQYDDLVIMFLTGEADFALVPFSVFHGYQDSLYVVPLLLPSFEDTSAYYRGAFIASTDMGAQSLVDAKGHVFAYTRRGSLHGYHMPRAALTNDGHDPNDFFSDVISIPATMDIFQALLDGEVDIGVIWADEETDAREFFEEEFPDILNTVEIIAFTPWIPNRVIVVRDDMPAERQQALREALIEISMDDIGQTALTRIYGISAFEELDERFWEAIEMMDLAEQLDDRIGPWP